LTDTECIQSRFKFAGVGSRSVVAQFDGGRITSDGGGLLLREVERRIGLLNRLAHCFRDGRDAGRVQHSVREMLAQRIYGLALGYEDLNDHEQLRTDPMMSVLADRVDLERPWRGKAR
jgi:Transposase DDE domain group 1